MGRVTAVSTGRGDIECEYVVNCGGQWAKALADTVGRTVLLGYIERRDGGKADRAWISQGRYQVAIGGELHQAGVSLKPPYDPSGERIRA